MIREIVIANVVTGNDRCYRIDALEKMLSDYNTAFSKYGHYFGGIDFPNNNILNINKIAFDVTSMFIEDDYLYGDIEILDNENGILLKSIIGNTVFRTYSSGTVDPNNNVIVDSLSGIAAIEIYKDSFYGLIGANFKRI